MRRRTLTLALFLLIPRLLYGQVAVDATTNGGGQAGASTQTFAHTVSGSNRYLVVGCATFGGGIPMASVTYHGVSMVRKAQASNSGTVEASWWGLVAPDTGTNNVVVTLSGSNNFICAATSLTGVDQTTPLGTCGTLTTGSGGETTSSVTVTGGASGLIFDVFTISLDSGTVTPTRSVVTGPTDAAAAIRLLETSSTLSGSTAMGYSWPNAFFLAGQTTCPILAASAPAGTGHALGTLGVGR